ncbi:MAG: PLP-dependent aminotransferase family protein, partial [Evtepia sp.]
KVNYVFSHDGIDAESFPFSIWGKLSREVINEFNHEMLAIGDSQGNIELRKSIAKYLYHSRGVHCDAEQIIVSAGIEILIQIFTQMLGQNHIYGIENPGYERLRLLFRSNQAHCHGIKIDDKGMILEEVIKSKANVICITPSHQFPSGVIMPINRRMQLINWANEMPDRYIIEDDYDSEFKYSGKPIPALQGLDRNGKVIYLGAFSKSLAPSIRISYMVLPKQLMKTYTEKLPYLVCPVPAFEQNVLHRFIQNGYFERHLNKMRNIYRKKREILIEEIFKIGGDMEVIGADAGLHLLLKVNNGMTETQLVATALDQGVKVNGISKFYFHENYEGEMGIVLLGFATMEKTKIPEAVQLLKKAWFCSI